MLQVSTRLRLVPIKTPLPLGQFLGQGCSNLMPVLRGEVPVGSLTQTLNKFHLRLPAAIFASALSATRFMGPVAFPVQLDLRLMPVWWRTS
jgi:hypothetical protein